MRDTTTTVILVRSSTARVGGAVAACLLQAWAGAGPAPAEVLEPLRKSMTEFFRCNFRHNFMSRHRHTLVAVLCMQRLLQCVGHTLCHDMKCVFQVAPSIQACSSSIVRPTVPLPC